MRTRAQQNKKRLHITCKHSLCFGQVLTVKHTELECVLVDFSPVAQTANDRVYKVLENSRTDSSVINKNNHWLIPLFLLFRASLGSRNLDRAFVLSLPRSSFWWFSLFLYTNNNTLSIVCQQLF